MLPLCRGRSDWCTTGAEVNGAGQLGLCTVPLPGDARGGWSPAPSEPGGALASSRSTPGRSLLSESTSTSAPARRSSQRQRPNLAALSDPRGEGSCSELGQTLPLLQPCRCTPSGGAARGHWEGQFRVTARTSPAAADPVRRTAVPEPRAASPANAGATAAGGDQPPSPHTRLSLKLGREEWDTVT